MRTGRGVVEYARSVSLVLPRQRSHFTTGQRREKMSLAFYLHVGKRLGKMEGKIASVAAE